MIELLDNMIVLTCVNSIGVNNLLFHYYTKCPICESRRIANYKGSTFQNISFANQHELHFASTYRLDTDIRNNFAVMQRVTFAYFANYSYSQAICKAKSGALFPDLLENHLQTFCVHNLCLQSSCKLVVKAYSLQHYCECIYITMVL